LTKTSVLFVCLGNICRSPTAHGVFEYLVKNSELKERVETDSCGTGDWHAGHVPDRRAAAEALKRGYDLSHLRARRVTVEDFELFDYILAMDQQNLRDLQAMCPPNYSGRLNLFLDYLPDGDIREVPDPYYGGDGGFTQVLDLVETASRALLEDIRRASAL
jgi:low molecular weight protein-tyrosine phosphatase